jgi:hypothetical protein
VGSGTNLGQRAAGLAYSRGALWVLDRSAEGASFVTVIDPGNGHELVRPLAAGTLASSVVGGDDRLWVATYRGGTAIVLRVRT